MKPSMLILIRHAPVQRVESCLPEHDPNAIIDEVQIRKLASVIPNDCVWYVSPLKRTIQTAKALSKYVTIREMILEKCLIEQNFGDWAGKKISEVWEELRHNKSQHNYSFICSDFSPPNGDSFIEQCNRISIWLEKLNFFKAQTVVVIAHAGTIRAALASMLGIEPDNAIGIEILHLSLNIFEVLSSDKDKNRGGRFRLLWVNKEAH